MQISDIEKRRSTLIFQNLVTLSAAFFFRPSEEEPSRSLEEKAKRRYNLPFQYPGRRL